MYFMHSCLDICLIVDIYDCVLDKIALLYLITKTSIKAPRREKGLFLFFLPSPPNPAQHPFSSSLTPFSPPGLRPNRPTAPPRSPSPLCHCASGPTHQHSTHAMPPSLADTPTPPVIPLAMPHRQPPAPAPAALDAHAAARDLAGAAIGLSLDAQATVFEMAAIVAALR